MDSWAVVGFPFFFAFSKLSFTEVSLEAGREKSGKGASTKAEVAQKRQFPLCGVGRRRYAEKGQRKGVGGAAATHLAVASLGRRNYQFKCHAMPKHFMRN